MAVEPGMFVINYAPDKGFKSNPKGNYVSNLVGPDGKTPVVFHEYDGTDQTPLPLTAPLVGPGARNASIKPGRPTELVVFQSDECADC